MIFFSLRIKFIDDKKSARYYKDFHIFCVPTRTVKVFENAHTNQNRIAKNIDLLIRRLMSSCKMLLP